MFEEFDALQDHYKHEANAWYEQVKLAPGLESASTQEKIDFAVASVQKMDQLGPPTQHQLAYHRACKLLGDAVNDIDDGNFSKSLMTYFLNNRQSGMTRERGFQSSSVMDNVTRNVLDWQFNQDHQYIYNFDRVLDKPTPQLNDIFHAFLEAGEIKQLAEAILYIAHTSDGAKNSPERHEVIEEITASLLARVLNRHDIAGADISQLVDRGDLKPRPLHQCPFYLDHVVPAINDDMREIAKTRNNMMISDDSVFWAIKDQLSDRELFNFLMPRPDKDHKLERWVMATAQFEAITGRAITVREALALEPQYGFVLSQTQAYKDNLDIHGGPRPSESYRTVDIQWETEGYDEEEDVFRATVTLESSAFLIDSVMEHVDKKSLKISEISITQTGGDFIRYELEFESETEMLRRRKDIRLQLRKDFMSAIQDVPLPGDVVTLVVPEDYDENDVSLDQLNVGETGVVTAVGRFGGIHHACKLRGIDEYVDPDHLEVSERPKVIKAPVNPEPEPQ